MFGRITNNSDNLSSSGKIMNRKRTAQIFQINRFLKLFALGPKPQEANVEASGCCECFQTPANICNVSVLIKRESNPTESIINTCASILFSSPTLLNLTKGFSTLPEPLDIYFGDFVRCNNHLHLRMAIDKSCRTGRLPLNFSATGTSLALCAIAATRSKRVSPETV